MKLRVLLASRSPRRRQLLEEAGYAYEVVPSGYDEPPPDAGERPEAYALRLAHAKAAAARELLAARTVDGVILAADTVVDLDGEILGSPATDEEAVAILQRLSGSRHSVVTGVVALDAASGRSVAGTDRTRLVMLPMGDDEIRAYVASGESRGKAGAYAIQESGDRFVKVLDGSLTNVVGLPMELVERLLGELRPER
jgi:septum formation protein